MPVKAEASATARKAARQPARKPSAERRNALLSLAIQHDEVAGELPVDRARIRRWVLAALAQDARLVLRFVGLEEARALNANYRRRDKATNVLTFAYQTDPVVEADIVICLPVLQEEAARSKIALTDHLAHLVVHGVLHAQGHDHEDDETAQRMEATEARILQRFRIEDPYLAERGDRHEVRTRVSARHPGGPGKDF